MVKPQINRVEAACSAMPDLQMFNIAGQVAGAVAHDFNNILTGVLGNLELMQRRADRLGIVDFNDYLAGARSAASRGADFSQSLLAFAGHQTLEPEIIQPALLIANTKARLTASFSGTEIVTVCPANVPDIFCDQTKLEDALAQLAKNALEAQATGKLTIYAETTNVTEDLSTLYGILAADYVAISLQDDGPGMNAHVAAHAFEPFFSTRGASGIGLSKILGFTRQSGGHAFIASHQPGNTKFTLLLPVAPHRS